MRDGQPLSELSVRLLTEHLASREPIPGGGSAAAIAGAIGAALVRMVVELSLGRPELAGHEAELREIGSAAEARRTELLELAERDAAAYGAVVRARRLPRASDAERAQRAGEIAAGTREATIVPLRTAEVAGDVLRLAERVTPLGNPNAISDAGVAALLSAAAVRGALLNVRINLPALASDDPFRSASEQRAAALGADVDGRAERALVLAGDRIGVAPPP